MRYSYSQLERIWLQAAAGTKYATRQWAALMAAIGMAESGTDGYADSNATNPNDNGGTQTSWGIWQISLGNHAEPSPDWNNPVTNAKLAIGKLETQGLSAWGTYDSGAYRQYYNGSTPPSTGNLSSGTPATTGGNQAVTVSVTSGLQAAGTLVHDSAEVLNFFFEFFQPGQMTRLGAGVVAVGTGYGAMRMYASPRGNDQLPLIFLLAGVTVMSGYMALRPWPQSAGKPIRPAPYAVDIIRGDIPSGSPVANETTPLEYGLVAILGVWVVSKSAGLASGAAGVIGNLWNALKGLGKGAESDLPTAAEDLSFTTPTPGNPGGQTVTLA